MMSWQLLALEQVLHIPPKTHIPQMVNCCSCCYTYVSKSWGCHLRLFVQQYGDCPELLMLWKSKPKQSEQKIGEIEGGVVWCIRPCSRSALGRVSCMPLCRLWWLSAQSAAITYLRRSKFEILDLTCRTNAFFGKTSVMVTWTRCEPDDLKTSLPTSAILWLLSHRVAVLSLWRSSLE